MDKIIIGRDPEVCDIVVDDPVNVISRQHAVISIINRKKFLIVDCSTNGTYVNGIKLEYGVEHPVTPDDIVSFAHVVNLDWSIITGPMKQKRNRKLLLTLVILLGVIVIGGGSLWYLDHKGIVHISQIFGGSQESTEQPPVLDSVDTPSDEGPAVKPDAEPSEKGKVSNDGDNKKVTDGNGEVKKSEDKNSAPKQAKKTQTDTKKDNSKKQETTKETITETAEPENEVLPEEVKPLDDNTTPVTDLIL